MRSTSEIGVNAIGANRYNLKIDVGSDVYRSDEGYVKFSSSHLSVTFDECNLNIEGGFPA
jgi:hypothetical protein